jgi:20S proteasome alpha/beta subunit
MTVCIAALCSWNYTEDGKPVTGPAIVTTSDRMFTVDGLGIEYEPPQRKVALFGDRILILVADSISVHSELLQSIREDIKTNPDITVKDTASLYSNYLRALKSTRASQYVLSVYGLSVDDFVRRQREFDPNLAAQLAQQLEDYQSTIKVQALIVGIDKDATAHIYMMDHNGVIHCYDDTGFACIGIGSEHANSEFMIRSYVNTWQYYGTAGVSFAAKKRAEIAPGVGKQTDMTLITKNGISHFPPDRVEKMNAIYERVHKQKQKIDQKALEEFMKFDKETLKKEGY